MLHCISFIFQFNTGVLTFFHSVRRKGMRRNTPSMMRAHIMEVLIKDKPWSNTEIQPIWLLYESLHWLHAMPNHNHQSSFGANEGCIFSPQETFQKVKRSCRTMVTGNPTCHGSKERERGEPGWKQAEISRERGKPRRRGAARGERPQWSLFLPTLRRKEEEIWPRVIQEA